MKANTIKREEERFDREAEKQNRISYLQNSPKRDGKSILILLLLAAFLFLAFFGGKDDLPVFSALFLLGAIASVIWAGKHIIDIIKNKMEYRQAEATMEAYLEDKLAKRKEKAVSMILEGHLPYRPAHKLTEHICPHCGMDCDYMTHVCSECKAGLWEEPTPNPAAKGDIQYMWCPKCGYRYLRQQFTNPAFGNTGYYKRWCPSCGYVLESSSYKR